jgi:hypothetical protein
MTSDPPALRVSWVLESRLQSSERDSHDEGWAQTDRELSGWLIDPSAIVDCGATPPSRDLIRHARSIAALYGYRGVPAPAMVVPDNNGGISFEFHSGGSYRNLEILVDRRVRWTIMRDGQVLSRRFID